MSVAVVPQPNVNQGFAKGPGESLYPNLWEGLVGLWLPGIRTGGVGTDSVIDFSANKNHGTPNGSMTTSDWVVSQLPNGQGGYSLDFDGADDFIDLGPSTYTFVDTQNFTVAGWFRLNVTADFENFWGGGNNTRFFTGNDDESDISLLGETGSVSWENTAFRDDGNFFHVVMRRINLDEVELFINARSEGVRAHGGTIIIDMIGANQDGLFNWDGLIMDFRLYDRVLTVNEIRQMFVGASPLTLARRAIGRAPVAVTTIPIFHHHYQTLRMA